MRHSSGAATITTLVAGITIGIAINTIVSAAFPGSSVFSDVPAGHFADDAIGRMYELGIIKGRGAGTFDPNGSLTRAEAAVLMDRLYAVLDGGAARNSSSSSSSWHYIAPASSSLSSSSSSTSSSSQPVSSVFTLSASEYGVMENGGSVSIVIVRSGDTGQPSSVSYSTTNDTASSYDYGSAGGTLTFGAGESTKTVTVNAKDNATVEGTRRLNFTLSTPSVGGSLGATSTAKIVIYDDESAELSDVSTFKFSSSEFFAYQNQGTVFITIMRTGSLGVASVSYATMNGTAIAESDYHSASGTVNFAIGETAKTFEVKQTTNAEAQGKTFQVTLSNPVSGVVGIQGITTVSIR